MAEETSNQPTPPRTQREFMQKTNREMADEWAIDVTQDPYALPIESLL